MTTHLSNASPQISTTDTPIEAERAHLPRAHARRRVLKGGLIAHEGLNTAIPCMVRDVSEGGAQLRVESGIVAPKHFVLHVEIDGTEADCDVVWRKHHDLGVRFTSAPRAGQPRRTQVVGSIPSPQQAKQKPKLRKPPRDADCW